VTKGLATSGARVHIDDWPLGSGGIPKTSFTDKIERIEMIEITASNFDNEVKNSDVPVILDFWAPWCGPCKSITPILEKLSGEYGGKVKVGKVNIDSEPALAQAFRVRSIPTIIGLVGGEVQDNSVGFRGEQPLREMFEKLSS
jgi:thioredoxin 1